MRAYVCACMYVRACMCVYMYVLYGCEVGVPVGVVEWAGRVHGRWSGGSGVGKTLSDRGRMRMYACVMRACIRVCMYGCVCMCLWL